MTREQAIEIFKDWIDEGVEYDGGYAARDLYEDEEQAVIMAIKALSQEPKLTGICNECLKKNGCEMYSQLIKSGDKYTVEGCEKYISKSYVLDRRVDENTVVFKTIDGKEVEYIRKDTCEDAISRDAVLKVIDAWYDNNRDIENIEDLIVLITYMDSVTPSRHKGHWIKGINTYFNTEAYRCSECNYHTVYKHDICPNCKTEMESSDAE